VVVAVTLTTGKMAVFPAAVSVTASKVVMILSVSPISSLAIADSSAVSDSSGDIGASVVVLGRICDAVSIPSGNVCGCGSRCWC